jgi:hypothetical protein
MLHGVSYVTDQNEGLQLRATPAVGKQLDVWGEKFQHSTYCNIFVDKFHQFNIWMFGRIHFQVCYIPSKLFCPVRGFLPPLPTFMARMQMFVSLTSIVHQYVNLPFGAQ